MPEKVVRALPTWKAHVEKVLESQLVLGALVALLTVATAYVAFRSTQASLDSSTLDFYAGKEMQQATILHLSGNANYMVDLTAFNAYHLLEHRNPELASAILSIGLGATAWVALLRRRSLLRLIFAILALASLIAALLMAFLYTGPFPRPQGFRKSPGVEKAPEL